MQESKIEFPSAYFLHSIGGNFNNRWTHLKALGSVGEQLIGWRDDLFDCVSELVVEFLLSVKLTHCTFRATFTISSVYGPCKDT